MNFLIVPGLAKSGTTYLFDQLSRNQDFFNPTKGKEVNYFPGGTDLKQYLELFKETESPKWNLDATPQYMESGETPIRNMGVALKGHQVKLIVCLREPFSRLFSHYLHDLKRHIAHLDVRDFMMLDHTAYGINALYKYLVPRAPQLRQIRSIFGDDSLIGFDLAKSVAEWRDAPILETFLGIDSRLVFDSGRVSNPGGWIPRLHYDALKHIEVIDGGTVYALPPRTLLVRNGTDSRIVSDFPRDLAERMIRLSQNWNFEFRPEWLGRAQAPIWDDYLEMLRLCGCERYASESAEVYRAVEPTLSKKVAAELKVLGTVAEDALAIWDFDVKGDGIARFPDCFSDRHSYGNRKKAIASAKTKEDALNQVERLLEDFEFSPKWLTKYVVLAVETSQTNRVLEMLKKRPYLRRYVNKEMITPCIRKALVRGSDDSLGALVENFGMKS